MCKDGGVKFRKMDQPNNTFMPGAVRARRCRLTATDRMRARARACVHVCVRSVLLTHHTAYQDDGQEHYQVFHNLILSITSNSLRS